MAPREETSASAARAPNSGEAPTVRDLTGRVLADFQVERLLGHGGMGEVYLARQVSLDRSIALKVLKPELAGNPTYMARFEAEAWAAAKLNHPNIVHIYTLGEVEGVRFIAMEYVQGTNLREYLVKKGVPELPLALSIMRQTGQAVGVAGESGLIHRDIKPENLLLTRKGQVKVADFGLCRTPEADRLHLTQPGVTLGTPMYMSPEQVQGQPLDHRSDLYSLGVTFYHMLAGFPPFRAESALALALKHVREAPISLAVHRPDLPPELVNLVMRLMAKAPADRYQSAAEMLRDLARIKEALQAASLTTATVEPSIPPKAEPSAEVARPGWRGWSIPMPGRRALIASTVVCLAAGALWGWLDRAENLLAESAAEAKGPPGLWLAPWETVPGRRSPESQYRYALLHAPATGRSAAWLAVAGRFPDLERWAHPAYVQLIRDLFRHGDAERLDALGDDLARPRGARSGREKWAALGRLADAAAAGLRDDAQEVLDQLRTVPTATMDDEVAELALEIVGHARRRPEGAGPRAGALTTYRNELLEKLRLKFIIPLENLRNPELLGDD
jgi:serine/threonine protein kinase